VGSVDDFFDRPAPAPEPPGPRPPSPPWLGPPDGVLPGVVGLELMLAANARAVVFVGGLAAFPTGLEFEVRVLVAPGENLEPSLNGVHHRPGTRPGNNYEEMLRFGVGFDDGRRATNVGGPSPRGVDTEGPVLNGRGGSGSTSQWRQGFWLWPLPPPGPLSFVCEWPAADLARVHAEIDSQVILDAAARARVVFPAQMASEPQFSWSSSTII
jgi:hypothetical protein